MTYNYKPWKIYYTHERLLWSEATSESLFHTIKKNYKWTTVLDNTNMIDTYSNLTLIIQTSNIQRLDLKKLNLNLKDREVGTGSYPFQKL